jgi:MoaA/NifB/PqqE/SkfB family radical SAM enzyme
MTSKLRTAVWWTTMACNFKCKYCWEVQAQERGEFKPEPFQPWAKWLEAWNRLKPQYLDITGGEPFLPGIGLLEVLQGLDLDILVSITSNLSHPILEFVQKVTPKQVHSITASFHPSENGTKAFPMNPEIFIGRVKLLQEFGFQVTTNIVAWPEQIWLIPHWVEMFKAQGIRWHVDPYQSIAYYPWKYTEAQQKMLRGYVTKERAFGVDPQPDGKVVACSGGINHISVQPDGTAWRCILERQQLLNPLGSIFDPEFTLMADPLPCHQAWQCPGCDRDKVSTYEIKGPSL